MDSGLVVFVATEREGALLRPHLRVVTMGVGAVNAACSVTRFLERERAAVAGIVVCGIGGGYPEAFEELGLGGVACAASECYGDLGADSPEGFLDMQAMGFPLVAGEPPVYNSLPLQLFPAERRLGFVTVNTCTGSDARGRQMAARTGGAVENMEGAAVAHVARLYGVPCGEIRGISNRAGDRDRSRWRVREAAAAAQEALLAWVRRETWESSGK